MRKWMSGRLKRRKKDGNEAAKEATKAPEPLQPKFYDNDPVAAPQAPMEKAAVEVREADHAPAGEMDREAEPAAETSATSGEQKQRPGRRRRGRGGRGRSRRGGAGASATPAVAPESAAKTPAEELPATAPTVAAPAVGGVAAPARASKGTVVLAIGLPGSGKSSWFKRHDIHPLSSDLLRELLFDDAQEQRFQDLVFSNLRSMLKARLIARRPLNYVDATNLTPHDRHSWIKLAKDYGYDVQGLFFDVPVEVCMERHQRRGRVVPEDIMRKMASKLKAPTFDEGFSKITVVRVKQKEAGGASVSAPAAS
jgi:predicted kinase